MATKQEQIDDLNKEVAELNEKLEAYAEGELEVSSSALMKNMHIASVQPYGSHTTVVMKETDGIDDTIILGQIAFGIEGEENREQFAMGKKYMVTLHEVPDAEEAPALDDASGD